MVIGVIAIDIGSSGVRATVVGLDGEVLDSRSAQVPAQAGGRHAELDPNALWEVLCGLVKSLPTKALDVRAVGVAAQLGCLLVDREGAALTPVVLWRDTRAIEQADQIQARGGDALRRLSGRPVTAELPACKVLWFATHDPPSVRKARWLLSLKDHLVMRLTGGAGTDETHASYTGLFDVRARRWSPELLGLTRVDKRLLPEVRPAASRAGSLTVTAARRLGLPVGLPVAVGGPDGTLGTLGAGAARAGVTVDVAGTTDVVLSVVDRPSSGVGREVVLNAHVSPELWSMGGPTGLTGGAVAWVATLLGYESVADAFAVHGEQLARMPPGGDGLMFNPALSGSRFPRWAVTETGAMLGLRAHHSATDLLHAASEAGAFVVADGIDALRRSGAAVKEVIVAGGLAAESASLQMRADILGLPVRGLVNSEATTTGAAIAAAVAAGLSGDLGQATDAMVRASCGYRPDPTRAAAYREIRRRWTSALDAARSA